MSKITVTLSAARMGDVDEADFDLWAQYVGLGVRARARTQFEIDVIQFRFADWSSEDRIEGAEDDERASIKAALAAMWDDFCGTASPWEMMRDARDKAKEARL